MLGNILLVLGILFLSAGVYMKMRSAPVTSDAPVAAVAMTATGKGPTPSETKGTEFEKWVADQFRRDLFQLKHWSGDKRTANGVSADSDRNPDQLWNLKLGNKNYPFAVECKWRSGFSRGSIDLAKTYQVKTYYRYAQDERIPVFIILGVGGSPSAPDDLYIVPIAKALEGVLSYAAM
jgi:hypothetical protein